MSSSDASAEQLKIFGGVAIALPDGGRRTESRSHVALVLTRSEFRVEHRYAWLGWTTFKLARMAPPGDPDGRKYLWSATWEEITDVRLRGGFLGVVAPGRGACRFNTGSRAGGRLMAEFLRAAGVQFESVRPTRAFIHWWRK
jgi:hypothetical protein